MKKDFLQCFGFSLVVPLLIIAQSQLQLLQEGIACWIKAVVHLTLHPVSNGDWLLWKEERRDTSVGTYRNTFPRKLIKSQPEVI